MLRSLREKFFNRSESSKQVLTDFQPHVLAIQDSPPSPFTRLILWVVVVLILVLMVWSFFGKIPIMTSAPAKFSIIGNTKVVQSLNTGTVTQVMVKVGQRVTIGQPIVKLNNAVNYAALSSLNKKVYLNKLEINRLLSNYQGDSILKINGTTREEKELAFVEQKLSVENLNNARSKLNYDKSLLAESQAQLESGVAKLIQYRKQSLSDYKIANKAKILLPSGAISGIHYQQLENAAIQSMGKFTAQEKKIIELKESITAADFKYREDDAKLKKMILKNLQQAQKEYYDLQSKQIEAKNRYNFDVLRSPVNGVIQNLFVAGLGAVVQAGQTVATVVPGESPLIVIADISSSDIGFVRAGQKVDIKVSAFPFEQYGMIKGVVLSVSPTAEPSESIMGPPPGEVHHASQGSSAGGKSPSNKNKSAPTLFYQVRIKPDRTWLSIAGKKHLMEPGMTSTVDIKTGTRSILEFFLSPVSKYINNGLYVQ